MTHPGAYCPQVHAHPAVGPVVAGTIVRPFTPLTVRPHTGFSLVELHVVIAIIAVRVAMLWPALQTARQSVFTVQCLCNQRGALPRT